MIGVFLRNKRITWLLTVFLTLFGAVSADAYTRWNGRYFLENTYASNLDNSTNLFRSGVNLYIRPPTKKKLDASLSVRFDYTNADGDSLWNLSPIGDLGINMVGERFAFNLQQTRTAAITADTELVENETSRVSLSLYPQHWPRITTSYTLREQAIDGEETSKSEQYALYADYNFRRWLNVNTGYNFQKRYSGNSNAAISDSLVLGLGVNRELLTRTQLTGGVDYVRSSAESATGSDSSSDSYGLRLGVESRPVQWLGLGGHFSMDETVSQFATSPEITTNNRYSDLTASVYPLSWTRFWSTVGTRTFDGESGDRSVDFLTFGGSLNRNVGENVSMNLTGSRTQERDQDQNENTRDSLALSSLLDLTPRSSLRFNLNVARTENPDFISTEGYDAEGTLDQRDALEQAEISSTGFGLPKDFTFFDTDNNDLFTKISNDPDDWSGAVRVDPPTDEKFSVNKSLQANLQVTDKLIWTLFYSINSSSDELDLLAVDRENLNSSMNYQPNRRTSYSLTGNLSRSAGSANNYNGTLSMNYTFLRGTRVNVSYGLRNTNDETTENFSANLRLLFRKRINLELVYASSQLFEDDQTDFLRIRFAHSF